MRTRNWNVIRLINGYSLLMNPVAFRETEYKIPQHRQCLPVVSWFKEPAEDEPEKL